MTNIKHCLATLAAATVLSLSSNLHAEIQKIIVVWTRGICTPTCIVNLERQLRRMDGVADINMNPSSATAVLQWNPNVPFSFQALEAPMSKIGLSIEHLRIRVQGTLSHDDNNIWLSSIGDGTRFVVLGGVDPTVVGYTETFNTESYRLPLDQRQQFIDAENQNLTVTIDGPIFMPERAPPLVILSEKATFSKPEEQTPQSNK